MGFPFMSHFFDPTLDGGGAASINTFMKLTSPAALNNDTDYDAFPGLIKRHNGDYLCVYRGNVNSHNITDGGDILMQVYNGSTWGAESTIQTAPSGRDLRGGGPIVRLSTSNYLLLCYTDVLVSSGHSSSNIVKAVLSTDDGATWGSPVTIDYSGQGDGFGILTNAPLQLANGDILVALRVDDSGDTYDNTEIYKSTDDGATWAPLSRAGDGDAAGRMLAEGSLTLLSNGDILCLMRDGDNEEIWYAISDDSGATWSTPAKAFDASGSPRTALFNGSVYVLSRSDDANEQYTWIFWATEAEVASGTWHGPHEIRETAPGTFRQNYGDLMVDGNVLYGVWSEEQSATDSDLYWSQIAAEVSDGDVVVADAFTRANSTRIGACDGGATGVSASGAYWVETDNGGSSEIVSNSLRNTATGVGANAFVLCDTGHADCTITAKITPTNSFSALRFRMNRDNDDGYELQLRPVDGHFRLFRRDNGAATQVETSDESLAGNTEYDVEVVLSGSSIECKLDSVSIFTHTSSTYSTQTFAGFVLDNVDGNTNIVDDFVVTRPA